MRYIVHSLLLLGITVQAVHAYDLTVNVSGAVNEKGAIGVALHNTAKTFPEGESFRRQIISADTKPLTVYFKNLPAGTYAISLMHDENENGILDRNFVGMPTEYYGFSNNARGKMGPPTFKQAMFEITDDNVMVAIDLTK